MGKSTIVEAVKSGRTLVSDGAWGTVLQKKGMQPGECPELWNVEHPDTVLDIAKSYIEAGADMIETDSFGGSRHKLDLYGLGDRLAELNEAAAAISRKAAGDGKWVIASLGPSGVILMMGQVTEDELYESFKQQAMALEKGGADAICVETMTALDEARIAVRAAKENTSCEVICTFTFDKMVQGGYKTMMGVTPADAAREALKAGADIIGANCGNGIERMIEVVAEMRAACPKAPILVHANAGLPQNINGEDVFPETPEEMAALTPALVKAGANIVGGCCGTTPDHIRAMKNAIA